MATLPVNLVVEGRPCVVVGGGAVAEGKVRALESRGAQVTVVAPEAGPRLAALAAAGRIVLHRRPYRYGDLEGAFFAVCASEDTAVREAVWREAQERGVLVNVVDDPARCTAIFPAIVRRGDLQVAICTDGRSPALAVRLKERLARELGPEYGELLRILGEARALLAGWRSQEDRARVWREIVDSDVLDLIRAGRAGEAEEKVRQWVSSLVH